MADYILRRSRRKTAALEVTETGDVIVRAPLRMPQSTIDAFVEGHRAWIASAQARQAARRQRWDAVTPEKEAELRRQAAQLLPQLVARYGAVMGLQPTAVKITAARTRFGSCSGKDSICFSWRLLCYPMAAVEYVVVHELAHITHKNHGPQFWALVAQVLPDYKQRQALLRT